MALTGSKLIHANSNVSLAVPTALQMVQGQIAINSTDKNVFIKDSLNNIVAVASALAVQKAMSAAQTVNGQVPDSEGAVVILPTQIGTFGVAPLDTNSKIPTIYLPASVLGAVSYQGTWDAASNTPTLPAPGAVKGNYYVATVAGTQFGKDYTIGDWVISDGVIWDKVESQDAISSVNGKVGTVILNAADVGALNLTGGSVSGTITLTGGATVTGIPTPVAASDATPLSYVQSAIAAAISGSGTVTSVDVVSNAATILTTTGGPITTNGAITLDLATQAAALVLAGPASGDDAKPTFRALASTDIAGLTLDEGSYS